MEAQTTEAGAPELEGLEQAAKVVCACRSYKQCVDDHLLTVQVFEENSVSQFEVARGSAIEDLHEPGGMGWELKPIVKALEDDELWGFQVAWALQRWKLTRDLVDGLNKAYKKGKGCRDTLYKKTSDE